MGRSSGRRCVSTFMEWVSNLCRPLVLVWDSEAGQEHLLACVGWIALDGAVIVGVLIYGQSPNRNEPPAVWQPTARRMSSLRNIRSARRATHRGADVVYRAGEERVILSSLERKEKNPRVWSCVRNHDRWQTIDQMGIDGRILGERHASVSHRFDCICLRNYSG